MTRAAQLTLAKLVDAQEPGGFTLPTGILDALKVARTLATTPKPQAVAPRLEEAGARILASVADGKPLDVTAVSRQMLEERASFEAAELAQQALGQAVTQAGERVYLAALDLADTVIVDHLRPAFEEVLTLAREHATLLGSTPLDTVTLMSAPAKVRDAYATLAKLEERRHLLGMARDWINTAGERRPQLDVSDEFALLRSPRRLFPSVPSTAALPRNWGIPSDDPVRRILWFVRDAAPAQPWLPTTAEQDAVWDSVYGEAARTRSQAASFARGVQVTAAATRTREDALATLAGQAATE